MVDEKAPLRTAVACPPSIQSDSLDSFSSQRIALETSHLLYSVFPSLCLELCRLYTTLYKIIAYS